MAVSASKNITIRQLIKRKDLSLGLMFILLLGSKKTMPGPFSLLYFVLGFASTSTVSLMAITCPFGMYIYSSSARVFSIMGRSDWPCNTNALSGNLSE